MSGTSEGARKAVETNRKKYGPEHFKAIGAEGGRKSLGRKHTAATRKKISRTKRKAARNADNQAPAE